MRKRTSSDSGSEGEDAGVLKARSDARNDEEDVRLRRQDLTFNTHAEPQIRRRRARESSYVHARITPPPIHPIDDDDIITPPSSPKLKPLQASAHFTEWRPLALSPRHDPLQCGRGYEPAGECLIRLRKSGRILSRPLTRVPFESSSIHHSSSTEQHGATSKRCTRPSYLPRWNDTSFELASA